MSDITNYSGLTSPEVEQSRLQNGVNVLTPPTKESLFRRFLHTFADPLVIILLVAGLLSVCISCYEYFCLDAGGKAFFEPVGIFVAIFLATFLGFWFEVKADREFAILNKVDDDESVEVIRDGRVTRVAKRDIVVGDIVILGTGAEIPADGRLLEAVSLNVDESSLTGEPICRKSADPADADPDATFPTDMVLRGTKVMEGHGVMEVTAVGDRTENGKVFVASKIDSSVKTPLDEQLDRLGKLISKIAVVIGIVIVAGRVVLYLTHAADDSWMQFLAFFLQTVMVAVTLVVCSVPEGLPMAVTVALAFSMRRMLRTNNLVRKLHACETMGATTVICTDKTGTLTENRMRVAHTDFFGNPPLEVIEEGIAVNTTAELDLADGRQDVLGNPTEGALLLWLAARGSDYKALRRQVAVAEELPFTTERKYMATVVDSPSGRRILYIKGAPEIIFGLCKSAPGITRAEVDALLLSYQNMGMRTLGFAFQELQLGQKVIADGRLVDVAPVFLGIAAISDPVRADVPEAVREVLKAGVEVKIVTGDTPATAREIARQIGLWNDTADGDSNIITGPDFADLTDDEALRRIPGLKIIARARPMDKKRLVELLQRLNEVVAVTGDGTNDAPALKTAQVGLSMGDGTAVAKEASDITIIDNSFSSIGRAIMWGRSLYQNIQRFILFQMTVNLVACLVVLTGGFMGMESPLTVTQMLWVNLIMDTFAAMALSTLPPSNSVMRDRPRSRNAFIISRAMWKSIVGTGLAFFAALIAFLYYLEHTDLTSLTEIGSIPLKSETGRLTPYELSLFFTAFVFLQFWNLFNARAFATGRSAFHFRGAQSFVIIPLAILVGQILIVSVGGDFFSVTPISLSDWLIIMAVTSLPLWVGEMVRIISRRR